MRLYNASLEKFKIQCNSFVLVFRPKEFTNCPDDIVNFAYEQVKDRGVFIVPPDVTEDSDEFKKRKRQALLSYLGITLRERIVNYYAMQDDFKRKGVTLQPDVQFSRALRWEKELRQLLENEAPIEEELSFLEAKRTENTQSKEPEKEQSFSEDENSPRKRGRPPKVSSEVSA